MRLFLLVVAAHVTGCHLLFPLSEAADADPGDDATPVTQRCPAAKVRDEFEVAGAPGRFWDPAVSATNVDGDLVLEASNERVLRSHRYYPIADGQSVTLEIPSNDLTQDGSFIGLRLRYDTSPSRFAGDIEHSVELAITHTTAGLEVFRSAKRDGIQEELTDLGPYDEVAQRFLRITYDQTAHQMVFATSPDGERFTRLGSPRDLPVEDLGIRAVQVELFASRVSLAHFASLCTDLAPARPADQLFEDFTGLDVPAAWQIVDRDCASIAPNGADLLLTFKSSGPSNCRVTTRTAYNLTGLLAVADLLIGSAGLQARSIVAVEREDGSRYQFVHSAGGMDQLHAEEVSPSGIVLQTSNTVIENPRFFHFHGRDAGLVLDFQLGVGVEPPSTPLLTSPEASVEAVQLQFAITGTATSAAQFVIRGTSSTQPTL